MLEELTGREASLKEFFRLDPGAKLLNEDNLIPEITSQTAAHLKHFNIEWHIIPSETAVPFDDRYLERLYPLRIKGFGVKHHGVNLRDALAAAHHRHQGKIICVETTIKPDYLPHNRQFYGTPYGFDPEADPFAGYMGQAGFGTGTRFDHNYQSLQSMGELINADWRARSLMPEGFRLTICSPIVFNLIGNVYHPEWSQTKSLELSAYRDDKGNAVCFAVGSNAPGDFSYVQSIETSADWTLLGFRAALVPIREI